MTDHEQLHAERDADDSSPIGRTLTRAGQVLLAVTLVGAAVAAALWFRATALDPTTSELPGLIWVGPRIALTLGFFVAAAALLERMGVPIYRRDEKADDPPWRTWAGVLGMSGALFLLARLVMAWRR